MIILGADIIASTFFMRTRYAEYVRKDNWDEHGRFLGQGLHYLASRNPLELKYLIRNGITDGFTMGYADISGFRLETCGPVNWINPIEEEAYVKVCELLDIVYKYNGEVVLLWHNSTVAETNNGYCRRLYDRVLQYLRNQIENQGGYYGIQRFEKSV